MPYQPNGDRANGRMYPNAVKASERSGALPFTRSTMKPKLSKIAAFPNWKQKFSKPIPVQSSAPLFSLQHARDFIGALPETEQASASWRTAERLVRQAAEHGDDLAVARVAVMRALHRR